MDWTSILTSLGTFTIGSVAVVIFLKLLAPHLLSLNLERYKAELKTASDRDLEGYRAELKVRHEMEMERLRADLKQIASQGEITFARLHEKRADVISTLYGKLTDLDLAVSLALSPPLPEIPENTTLEIANNAASKVSDCMSYIRANRIYFDAALNRQLREVSQLYAQYVQKNPLIQERINPSNPSVARNALPVHLLEELRLSTGPIINTIETSFRSYLDPPKQPPT